MPNRASRRNFLNATLAGAAGAAGLGSIEEQTLLAALEDGVDVNQQKESASQDDLPMGKIGNLKISRLMIGGNLIGGWAHARDLIYVSRLFKAYNTESKVFETLELAEERGINTIQIDPACQDILEKYRKQRGGKIQTMVCIKPRSNEQALKDRIKELIDKGADTMYTHGAAADRLVMDDQIDTIGKTVDLIKKEGLAAGIGSHSLETPIASEKHKLNPDYYVKTFHPDRYWSATPEENREEWCWYKGHSPDHDKYHDNMFCLDADKTAEFMETVEKPWVAFKVMAAGAIHPRIGFHYAFRGGADFVIAGMFDFQIIEDVQFARQAITANTKRKRAWRA